LGTLRFRKREGVKPQWRKVTSSSGKREKGSRPRRILNRNCLKERKPSTYSPRREKNGATNALVIRIGEEGLE